MYVQHRGRKWRFNAYVDGTRRWLTFDSYDDCYKALVEYRLRKVPRQQSIEIENIEEVDDTEALWDYAKANQSPQRKDIARILLPTEPFAIAFLSDLHIGSKGTDYDAIKSDAETVAKTEGMYAVFHGDGIDNWIVPKLSGLQRGQLIPFDAEMALFRAWLTTLGSKLMVVVAGNHDNWTKKMAGVDFLKPLTPPTAVYHPYQQTFDVDWGDGSLRICVRHKWRGTSIHNPTHGIERASKDIDADIYVGGHTHIGTLFRNFTVRGRDRVAILTGTYKVQDEFGVEVGLPEPEHRGCGVLVVDVNGDTVWLRSTTAAAKYLTYLRGEYGKTQNN